jgi:hypothetical protein
MKHSIYVLFDKVAGAMIGQPMMLPNVAVARRFWSEILASDQNLSSHPDDYELVLIGYFDHEAGQIFDVIPFALSNPEARNV